MASLIMRAPQTVAEAMLASPKTHGLEITVSDAEAAFSDAHVHMLLLTRGGVLHGTLLRSDLETHHSPHQSALELASFTDRTIGPDEPIGEAFRELYRIRTRRLAVIDGDRRLLGLLCLKRALDDFCSLSDVLARTKDQPVASTLVPGRA